MTDTKLAYSLELGEGLDKNPLSTRETLLLKIKIERLIELAPVTSFCDVKVDFLNQNYWVSCELNHLGEKIVAETIYHDPIKAWDKVEDRIKAQLDLWKRSRKFFSPQVQKQNFNQAI